MCKSNINYKQSKYFDTDIKMKSDERLKKVPNGDYPNYNLKEGEYNLYDLLSKVQDEVIQKYIEHNPIIRKYAIDVLKHFVFDDNGKIIRGFDE